MTTKEKAQLVSRVVILTVLSPLLFFIGFFVMPPFAVAWFVWWAWDKNIDDEDLPFFIGLYIMLIILWIFIVAGTYNFWCC